ncbi:hypothetical protein HDU97_008892 [Phlyctochytrium planicorne]|nr:hypothetical protein HDU97_008892 [Phlyctochytrium planicorne]
MAQNTTSPLPVAPPSSTLSPPTTTSASGPLATFTASPGQGFFPNPYFRFIGASHNPNYDTPSQVNARISSKTGGEYFTGYAIFRYDGYIDYDAKNINGLKNITIKAIAELNETGTDAILVLSVLSLNEISLDSLGSDKINMIWECVDLVMQAGRRLFLRLFPNMNSQFNITTSLPQNPVDYIQVYRRLYNFITTRLPSNSRNRINFLWSPDCRTSRGFKSIPANFPSLDTDGNGVVDKDDDPYQPYYPGASVVDWVGCEYYYRHPDNVFSDNAFESMILNGIPEENYGRAWSLYKTFGGEDASSKPFMVVGLGAGYSIKEGEDPAKELEYKQKFWNAAAKILFEPSLTDKNYFKAICLFEDAVDIRGDVTDYTNLGLSDSHPLKVRIPDFGFQFVKRISSSYNLNYANDTRQGRNSSGPRQPPVSPVFDSRNYNGYVDPFIIQRIVVPAIACTILAIIFAVVVVMWCRRRKREKIELGIAEPQHDGTILGRLHTMVSTAKDVVKGGDASYPSFPSFPMQLTSLPPKSKEESSDSDGRREGSVRERTSDGGQEDHDDNVLTTAALTASVRQRDVPSSQPIDPTKLESSLFPPTTAVDLDSKSSLFHPAALSPDISKAFAVDGDAMPVKQEPDAAGDRRQPGLSDVSQWDVEQVRAWLVDAGVSQNIVDIMKANNVNGYSLLLISDQSLRDIGIGSATARNLMLYAVSQLRDGGSTSTSAGTVGSHAVEVVERVTATDAPPEYSK